MRQRTEVHNDRCSRSRFTRLPFEYVSLRSAGGLLLLLGRLSVECEVDFARFGRKRFNFFLFLIARKVYELKTVFANVGPSFGERLKAWCGDVEGVRHGGLRRVLLRGPQQQLQVGHKDVEIRGKKQTAEPLLKTCDIYEGRNYRQRKKLTS
jgi:hypothetical protein